MEDDSQKPKTAQLEKLTDWANEPTLETLKLDLESAKSAHDSQIAKIHHWNNLLQVKEEAKPNKIKNRSSVQPKLIRRQAEWRYSALTEPFLGSSKLFKVSPVTFEDELGAKQNELVLNWQFRTKLNRVKFIDDYVRSVVDDGTCIVRVGWKRVTKPVKKTVPVWNHFPITDEQHLQILKQAMDLKQDNPRDYDETIAEDIKASVDYYEESQQPTYAIQKGTEEVDDILVIENHPECEVIHPDNFYPDPSCNGDFTKALFAVVSFETNKAELQKQGKRYTNLDKVNWESATPRTDAYHISKNNENFQFNDKARKKVVVYEYWGFFDVKNNGELVPFVAAWIGNVMIRMEMNPFPDEGLPFVLVPYLPVKRELYGEPDAELLEDNQAVLGAVVRGMIDLMGRSANGQLGFAKGMLDPLNRRRYDNGQDYEFNPNLPTQTGIVEHKYPEIPNSAMTMVQLQNEDAESLTGVKSFAGGISGESYGDIAANARGAMDAAAKREMSILRRLAKGVQDIGAKIISMNAEFLSEKETVRVTNAEYVEVKREDLKGNFDLEVDIATAEVDNAKAQDLGFMLQTVGPNMDKGIFLTILAEIADLKRMPALAHKLRNYQPPPPDPMAVQMQQLELQKAQADIARIKSEIDLNEAKAGEVKAKKDKTNLDFVEQESGTEHAREMEKMQAQGRANQALEVTKTLTRPTKPDESKPDVAAAIGYNHLSDMMAKHDNMSSPSKNNLTFPQTQVAPQGNLSYPAVNDPSTATPVQ